MFPSPSLAPPITNPHVAPIPAPMAGSGAATGPGAIKTATPATPAPIAVGPITMSPGGHSSESNPTQSAAVVHANDAKVAM